MEQRNKNSLDWKSREFPFIIDWKANKVFCIFLLILPLFSPKTENFD